MITNADMSYCKVFESFGFKAYQTSTVEKAVSIVLDWTSGTNDIFLEFHLDTDKYAKTITLIRDREIIV